MRSTALSSTLTRHSGGVAVVLAAALLTACGPTDSASESSTASSTQRGDVAWTTTTVAASPSKAAGSVSETSAAALVTLDRLPMKGRAPKTGYSRDLFGQKWSDDVSVEGGHNGCDTRNDILKRDLTDITFKPGTRNCTVAAGTLNDAYTGKKIDFVRGQNTSTAVQIDHVVALSDAWRKGAQQLSTEQRTDFANDPRNLQAVDGPTNARKSDGDAATWLPPKKSYRCTYVARQIEVKAAYRLWVTAAEKSAMQRVLNSCGGTEPSSSTVAETQESTTERPAPRTTRTTDDPPPTRRAPLAETPDAGGSVYYPNCSAVRSAGAAPIYRGQPGYSSKLDRDGDGVACE